MAIVADFMLVWLPAPTVSLRPPPSVSAGLIAKFFFGCPENAFQVNNWTLNLLLFVLHFHAWIDIGIKFLCDCT